MNKNWQLVKTMLKLQLSIAVQIIFQRIHKNQKYKYMNINFSSQITTAIYFIIYLRQLWGIFNIMKVNKGDAALDFKTGNSQMSDIDLFSKLESNFLEKYFRYNLSDYFSDDFSNIYEDRLERKVVNKSQKPLASSLFIANSSFTTDQFEKKIENFYLSKSKSIRDGHLPFAFKKLYSNLGDEDQTIKPQQLILIQVKIKAEVYKIQEVPQKIANSLAHLKHPKREKLTQIQQILTNYKSQYFNIFFVYFGDVNFSIFNKSSYQNGYINLMGKKYRLRITVFFISKQSLIESFKIINKLQNLNLINDLLIQFYELKREKMRRKKLKSSLNKINSNNKKLNEQPHFDKQVNKLVGFSLLGVVGLTIFGFTIKKIFF